MPELKFWTELAKVIETLGFFRINITASIVEIFIVLLVVGQSSSYFNIIVASYLFLWWKASETTL